MLFFNLKHTLVLFSASRYCEKTSVGGMIFHKDQELLIS